MEQPELTWEDRMKKSQLVRGISLTTVFAVLLAAIVLMTSSGKSDELTLEETPAEAVEVNESEIWTDDQTPAVYMTSEITSEALVQMFELLDRELPGNVAVKLSTGEPGGHNFLSPDLIKDLVQQLDGTIVECNTAYGGPRAATALHRQVVIDHGFADIAPVDILDAEGSMTLTFPDAVHIKENYVGANFKNYDSYLVLSHFKGHAMGGFGGALKNISIGLASASGKSWIHTAGKGTDLSTMWGLIRETEQDHFLESMAEASGAVMNALGDNIVYINVMNRLSVDCDCSSNPAEPTMADIGILASLDPVALDKACVDMVYAAHDGHDLIERMETRNGTHILDHAVALGIGSMDYNLVRVDG